MNQWMTSDEMILVQNNLDALRDPGTSRDESKRLILTLILTCAGVMDRIVAEEEGERTRKFSVKMKKTYRRAAKQEISSPSE